MCIFHYSIYMFHKVCIHIYYQCTYNVLKNLER